MRIHCLTTGPCGQSAASEASAASSTSRARERDSPELSSFCRGRHVVFLAVHDPRAQRLVEAAS